MNEYQSEAAARAVERGDFEVLPCGILLPSVCLKIGGVFSHEVIRNGRSLGVMHDHNLIVDDGLDHILDVVLNGQTGAQANWYVGLLDNHTPIASDDMSTIGSAQEVSDYSEGARPAWTPAAASGQSITNSASKATFNMNPGGQITVYGAFLTSNSTKDGTTGVLFAASNFAVNRQVVNGDQLLVTYTVQATG